MLNAAIDGLRAEHDACDSPGARAILLHEIGVLEERLGDEAAAARDLLGAINGDPEFREPLERLLALIERRQSHKNLGRLLDRLTRVAETPDERSRALLEQAAFLADHEDNPEAARELLLAAIREVPEDTSVWLSLELLAARTGDTALAEQALTARAEHAYDPTWRALLLLDLAHSHAERQDFDRAIEAVDQAVALGALGTFPALLVSERIAARGKRPDLEGKALETQGELVLRALTEPADGDALGVPRRVRSRAHVADAWLRAAECYRLSDASVQAANLLDRALQEVPGDLLLVHARLTLAEATGDTQLAANLARVELEHGADGEIGAALCLRIAEDAASRGVASEALIAVQAATRHAPGCVPARALELELLAAQENAPGLASALEATAEHLVTDAAKANFYLASAEIWGHGAGDIKGAKAALSQAALFSAPPGLVARVARLLAIIARDPAWYEESTRRLLAQGSQDDEVALLWFELGRARALRGELTGARAAFASLASSPGGEFLGNALGAFAAPLIKPSPSSAVGPSIPPPDYESWTPLARLSAAAQDPDRARALGFSVALRSMLEGNTEQAIARFAEIHALNPSDLVTTGALSLLHRSRGKLTEARDVLLESAATIQDPDAAVSLLLSSGLLSWQAGERTRAIEILQRASEDGGNPSSLMLAWALRSTDSKYSAARAHALEAFADDDPALWGLELFGLQVARGGSAEVAEAALQRLDRTAQGELQIAGRLGRALWSHTPDGRELRRNALDNLSRVGPEVARLAGAAAHQLELQGSHAHQAPDAIGALETASSWARTDPSAAAALEWLAFCCAAEDRSQEIAARTALAERLAEPIAAMIRASAGIVAALTTLEPPALNGEHPALCLTRLELTLPGTDPRKRADALSDAVPFLGEDSGAVTAALVGYNRLAAGDLDGAFSEFSRVVDAYPSEPFGWEGVRAAAEARGDRHAVARACAALGDAVSDAKRGAEFWESAASILLDDLSDPARGEFALTRAFERDPERFSAFDRLFRIVRARKDGARMIELISKRLEVATDEPEIVKLHWERARAFREAGDREAALEALTQVREREPDHIGGLALTGEICITLGRYAEAAEHLERLAQHPEAPGQQRLLSGVAAIDLYENRLDNPARALAVLSTLYRAGLSTEPVRERLARAAAKVEAWEQATEVLEQLMTERATQGGRVEAARLAMAIYRDELGMPEAAEEAVTQLLREAPSDAEALDLVLTDVFSESLTRSLLEQGVTRLVAELAQDPTELTKVDRLARIAAKLDRPALRQAALGCLVALGADADSIDPELVRLDQRVARLPKIAIDEQALPALVDPQDSGPIGELMRAIASTIADAVGPNLSAFGVSRRERVDPRAGHSIRNEIAAWAGALGVNEFELYVGGNDPTLVAAVPTETPALILGDQVEAPLSPFYRQAVARELLALRRGTTILRHRDADGVHALLVAACRIAEVELPAPSFALLGEFQRQLAREMPRRVRKALTGLAQAVLDSGQDPIVWYGAAGSTLDRLAAVAAGDVSWVLAKGPAERGQVVPTQEAQRRIRRLLSFVLSPSYLEIRDRLGMGLR